jgi:hypothetical protein
MVHKKLTSKEKMQRIAMATFAWDKDQMSTNNALKNVKRALSD